MTTAAVLGLVSPPSKVWINYKESNWIWLVIWIVLLICFGREEVETKSSILSVVGARFLFSVLGCVMLATLAYTIATDGSPFRVELLTPWMSATLVDFYVNVIAISVWVAYKEPTYLRAVFWIILFICFGRYGAVFDRVSCRINRQYFGTC